MLDEAEINSPLTGLSAASSTEDLGPVSAEELWREGFEGPQQRLSVTGDCDRTYDDLRGGFVLACRNEGQAGAVLAVHPETYYRIRLSAVQSRHLGYSVSVTEHAPEAALRIFQFQDLGES